MFGEIGALGLEVVVGEGAGLVEEGDNAVVKGLLMREIWAGDEGGDFVGGVVAEFFKALLGFGLVDGVEGVSEHRGGVGSVFGAGGDVFGELGGGEELEGFAGFAAGGVGDFDDGVGRVVHLIFEGSDALFAVADLVFVGFDVGVAEGDEGGAVGFAGAQVFGAGFFIGGVGGEGFEGLELVGLGVEVVERGEGGDFEVELGDGGFRGGGVGVRREESKEKCEGEETLDGHGFLGKELMFAGVLQQAAARMQGEDESRKEARQRGGGFGEGEEELGDVSLSELGFALGEEGCGVKPLGLK